MSLAPPEHRHFAAALEQRRQLVRGRALSPRDLEVLYVEIVEGRTNAETARRLRISLSTVELHMSQAALKLGYGSMRAMRRDMLIAYARASAPEGAGIP